MSGNALAIELLGKRLANWSSSPKEMYFSLLAGESLCSPDILRLAQEHEGYRSLVELTELIDNLRPKLISTAGLHLSILSPFWKTIPAKELAVFVYLYGSQATKDLPMFVFFHGTNALQGPLAKSSEELARNASNKARAMMDDPDHNLPPGNDMEKVVVIMMNALIKSLFLEKQDMTGMPVGLRSKGFLTVNPLLPIMLRAQPDYLYNQNGRDAITKAFTLFYAYRTKRWPMEYMYSHAVWEAPRLELQTEFENFASAAHGALSKDVDESNQLAAVNEILTLFHRGTAKDLSRCWVVRVLWERRVIHLVEIIERLVSTRTMSNVFENDDTIAVLRETAVSLTLQLLAQYSYMDVEKVAFFYQLCAQLVHDLKREGQAQSTPTGKKIVTVSTYEHWLKLSVLRFGDLSQISEDEIWASRNEMVKRFIEANGVEFVVPDPNEAVNASSAQNIPYRTTLRKAMEAMKGDDYAKAQHILDNGLLVETNKASNDTSNKVDLLRFRALISQLHGKSEEALETFEETYRLEDASGKPVDQKARDNQRARKGHHHRVQ